MWSKIGKSVHGKSSKSKMDVQFLRVDLKGSKVDVFYVLGFLCFFQNFLY